MMISLSSKCYIWCFLYWRKLLCNDTTPAEPAVREWTNKLLRGWIRTIDFVLKVQDEVVAEQGCFFSPHLPPGATQMGNSTNIALDKGVKGKSNKRKENTGNTAMLGKTAPVRGLMRVCSAAVHLRVDISAQGRARTLCKMARAGRREKKRVNYGCGKAQIEFLVLSDLM